MNHICVDNISQVTVEYKLDNGACVPQRVHTVLISAHHSEDVTNDLQGSIKTEVFDKVVKVIM